MFLQMISLRSTIYVLKLNSSSDPENPSTCFYTKGLSAGQIALDKAHGWEIFKCYMKNGKSVELCLNSRFIAFQRLWRAYSGFRKRVINLRFLRKREETGISSREWSPPNRLHLYKDTIITLQPRAPNQQSRKRLPSFFGYSQGL
jgi:hypothetical protein